jgi:hypothetical protein
MKRSNRLRWIGVLALAVLVASVATAAAGAASSGDPTKPSKPAFSVGAAGQVDAAGTISPRSVPRRHLRPDEEAEVDPPTQALLMRRAGITKAASAVPLSGNATTNLRGQGAGNHASRSAPNRAGKPDAGAKQRGGGRHAAFGSFLENLNSFTGATLNNTGCCEPPDTQIAASSTRVLEPVNLTAFVFNHGGSNLGSFDLVSFMGLNQPNNFGSDPKVVYDQASDRWFMVLMVCQQAACGGNWTTMGVNLAVSQTNDPFGSWLIYQNIYSGNPFNDQGNLQDQPKLGFSGDKVTISDNVYSGHCGSGSCFLHEDVTSWNKAELFTGSAHYFGWTSGFAFDSIPASPSPSSASSTNTQFVTWQGFGSLGISQITGLPNVSTVSQSTQNPTIASMTGTVAASGVPAVSGNFIEASTWNNNRLWAASTDGCTRGSGTVDCTRIDEVNTSNPASLTVALDQDVGDAGAFEIYPSVAQDCLGDLYFGVTYSDSSTLPSASMIASTTPGASTYARVNYATGDTAYTGGRWGDYSGIQEDPGDCGNMWTAQEYGAVGSGGNWATSLGQFSFDTPSISSVSPHSGPATGGTLVDIFGFDFVNHGTSVSFGSTPAVVFFVDAHHLQAISPRGSGGPVNITATTANGTATASSAFSWVPAVTSLNPSAGPTAGGNTVHILGAGFNGATGVAFGGVAASFTVNNDGDISATAPAHSAGAVHVTVTGPTGTSALSSPADVYTYDAPPTLTSVSPTRGPAAGGNTVTINGTNFVSGSTVKFGTTASPSVTFVSSTQVKAKAPAHTPGLVNVTVTTPGGTTPIVTGDHYTFVPAPTIASLSPKAGPTAGGNTVTINGANFDSSVTVRFGATASSTVTFVSATQIRARAPAHAAGSVNVSVRTATGGTSTATNASLYAYGAPTVSSVSPNGGSTAGGNTVVINGNGFVPGVTVRFGATASSTVTFVSGTQIRAKVPAHSGGLVNVLVTSPAGTSATGNGSLYEYGSPSVSSVSPNGGFLAGGNTVTIHGSGFVPGVSVQFGSTPSTTVTFVSTTQITAKAPAHSAGTVSIRVISSGHASAITNGSLYAYGAPSVTSINPHTGPAAGGTTVTINGSGFVPGATVKFGANASTTVTFVSSNQIRARAPAHSAGNAQVRVTTPGGTSALVPADLYTYS